MPNTYGCGRNQIPIKVNLRVNPKLIGIISVIRRHLVTLNPDSLNLSRDTKKIHFILLLASYDLSRYLLMGGKNREPCCLRVTITVTIDTSHKRSRD